MKAKTVKFVFFFYTFHSSFIFYYLSLRFFQSFIIPLCLWKLACTHTHVRLNDTFCGRLVCGMPQAYRNAVCSVNGKTGCVLKHFLFIFFFGVQVFTLEMLNDTALHALRCMRNSLLFGVALSVGFVHATRCV